MPSIYPRCRGLQTLCFVALAGHVPNPHPGASERHLCQGAIPPRLVPSVVNASALPQGWLLIRLRCQLGDILVAGTIKHRNILI